MDENKTEHILLISLFTLIIFPLLYVAKLADDNTFTSWKWVFSETNILHIFLFLVIGTSVAFAFSRLSLSGPYSPLFLFIFSFAGILPLWNEPESIIDASRYFLQAKSLKEYGTAYFFNEWGRDINAWTDMPLIPFIYGLIFKFLGEVRAYIQAFTTLLFASTVVLTYFIGKILWNEETGFNAGLLLMGAISPYAGAPHVSRCSCNVFSITFNIYLSECPEKWKPFVDNLLISCHILDHILKIFSSVHALSASCNINRIFKERQKRDNIPYIKNNDCNLSAVGIGCICKARHFPASNRNSQDLSVVRTWTLAREFYIYFPLPDSPVFNNLCYICSIQSDKRQRHKIFNRRMVRYFRSLASDKKNQIYSSPFPSFHSYGFLRTK